jgi:ribonuclease P protein subunit RPR2
MRKPTRKPPWQKSIAKERIDILFRLAAKEFESRPERSHRYVELARKIAKRYNIKLKKSHRRRLCRKCLHYLKPGANSRSRMRPAGGALTVTCLDCGNVMRFPCRRGNPAGKAGIKFYAFMVCF